MKKMKVFAWFMVAVLSLGLFFACKKTYPPPPYIPIAPANSITIAQLRAKSAALNGAPYKFTQDLGLYAVVTMDETSGNIYKQVYVRDYSGVAGTTIPYGAIMLNLKSSGGFYQGDSILLNLKGCRLDVSTSGGYLQIDSVDVTTMVKKLKSALVPVPYQTSILSLNTTKDINNLPAYDAQFIMLNSVEFTPNDTGVTKHFGVLAPVVINTNYTMQDCNGDIVTVYTSGYANFAQAMAGAPAPTVPGKNGSVVAISSVYSAAMQLTLHSYAEMNMTNAYCVLGVRDSLNMVFRNYGITNKNAINLPNWYNIAQSGSLLWMGTTPTGTTQLFPSASTYNSTDPENVIWLITPQILYDKAKTLQFQATTKYNTGNINLLDVYVSTNFTGTNLSQATWTLMTPSFAPCGLGCGIPTSDNGYIFQPTSPAPVPIPNVALGQSFCIGFRYKGTANINYPDSSATYGIDDVIIH